MAFSGAIMKPLVALLSSLALTAAVSAEELGQLLFEDNFERSESQEKSDEIGKGWGTNSKSRAKGNKQVDLRDGAMYIYISSEADHAVSVTHPAEFTDGAVSLRFMLEDDKDSLGLDFADLGCKKVHAGLTPATRGSHAFHIREAALDAVVLEGEALVVEAEEVEDGGVEVVERMDVLRWLFGRVHRCVHD
jgi:hypothetical protein